MTRAASRQTYYTIRFLADRHLVDDAYRAYAYFRWVDDWLDQEDCPRLEGLAFLRRQQALITSTEEGSKLPDDLQPEEALVVELLHKEPDKNSGLHAYIHNLMSVMAFDAERRGRLATRGELADYTHWLAVAVTEAMHYFIGHDCPAPCTEKRYLAVTGAHITHMLRDTWEDVASGYHNIPQEVLEAGGITPTDIENPVYRTWVQERVKTARACFQAGRDYLVGVPSLRCQIAAYAYMFRFESVLTSIEHASYRLPKHYSGPKGQSIETIGWAVWMALKSRQVSF
jgi:phytoene/squalene synthetase